jgi:fatty-acyl-CoA synthase
MLSLLRPSRRLLAPLLHLDVDAAGSRPWVTARMPRPGAAGRCTRTASRLQSTLGVPAAAAAAAPSDAKMAKWDIKRTQANYTELSPLTFLKRAERVYPNHTSVVHGSKSFTWRETAERCRRLASALTNRGIARGDTVAVIASNTPEMNECHFGVPMTGAVLLAINTRLDAAAVAFSLEHSEASMLITDTEFAPMVREALKLLEGKGRQVSVVDIADSEMPHYNTADQRLGDTDYEELLRQGDPTFAISGPRDEWDPIAVGYTSGTTGNPKGVVTHHRGAYLNALSNAVGWDLGHHPRYLWTLPMFHCNGWCFPWTLAAVGGTSICLRKVTAEGMYKALAVQGATHMCGAPIILNTLLKAPESEKLPFSHKVKVMTAAAPPPPSTLQAMQEMGFEVTHVYGLTETYGPAVICAWNSEWDALPVDQQGACRHDG